MAPRMKAVLVVRVLFLAVVVIRYDCAVVRNAKRNTYINEKLSTVLSYKKLVKGIRNIFIYVANNLLKFGLKQSFDKHTEYSMNSYHTIEKSL